MADDASEERPVELLRELGLKEYESRCFVALTRVPEATAKEVSEISDIPRTRVYDAMRVLETKGLVEVHHSTPQRFRAVTVTEAVQTLRSTYEDRFDRLETYLEDLQPVEHETEPIAHEVWSLSGSEGIASRTQELITDADREIVFILGARSPPTSATVGKLNRAVDRDVEVYLGATDDDIRDHVDEAVPDAQVFESGLDWLKSDASGPPEDVESAISQLLLIDRNVVLIGSITPTENEDTERAVFGRGFSNGLIVILRRILSTGVGLDEASIGDVP